MRTARLKLRDEALPERLKLCVSAVPRVKFWDFCDKANLIARMERGLAI